MEEATCGPLPMLVLDLVLKGSVLAFFSSTTHVFGISFMYVFIAGWIESRALHRLGKC